jgi:methyl-accepting chemotaxis protein-1 (serine sensor receptor)
MKLSVKLPCAFAAVLLLMAAAALIGIQQLHQAVGVFDVEVQHATGLERNVLAIELLFKGQVQEWKDTLLRGKDPAKLDKYWTAFQAKEAKVQELCAALKQAAATEPDVQRGLEDFMAAHAEMGQRYRAGFQAFKQANFESAAGDSAVAGMDRAPTQRLTDLAKLIGDRTAAVSQEATAAGRRAAVESVVLMAIVSVCGIAAGLLISRSVIRLLGGDPAEATRAAHAIAQGDLTTTLALKSGDSTSLMCSLARMQDSLAALVGQLQQNADAVACASSQIAQGNGQLSARTEEQAAALEETVASMQELNVHVARNAEHAVQAHDLAEGATQVANRGGEVVTQVVTTMKEIDASSKRIADINGVIDSIAFQTNILALNAAVEAARAGEQGRGFAVVAAEVRTLAQRSAQAAREIKDLIATSVSRVEQGASLVDQAGATMKEVYEAIERVSLITREISEANRGQSEGVAQLSEAMRTMDSATQQNAALVEETAAASESLKMQASQMLQLVSQFRLSRPAFAPAPTVEQGYGEPGAARPQLALAA